MFLVLQSAQQEPFQGNEFNIQVCIFTHNLHFEPVRVDARQLAYQAGALCRDFTSSLIPLKNLLLLYTSRWAGSLSEISLKYWRGLGRWDEKEVANMNIPASDMKTSVLPMHCVSKHWARVAF